MSESASIFPTIRDGLTRRDLVFVFPSEITAAFWRAEAARRGPAHAVRADRFLSWDSFKEQVLQERDDLAPVNRTMRMLFAADLIARNAEAPFLRRIVDPTFASEADAFVSEIERILPTLHVLSAEAVRPRLEPRLRSDVDELSRRYRRFLSDNGLFEPAWEAQSFDARGREYLLFYPGLITDFEEFAPALRSHPAVRFAAQGPAASGTPTPAELLEYGTSRVEIRALCGRLEELLDAGTAPADIAVTVCGKDAFLTYFEAACRRRSIPTSLRAGRPLTEYPAGRFFENLRALPGSGYSLRAMQALLLDRAVPWRDARALRRLLRLGIQAGCLRNYRDDGREQDVWLAVLTDEDNREARRLYRKLRAQTRALSVAADFEDLRTRLYEFFGTFLDTSAWSASQLRVFQSSLDVLSDLIDTAERVDLRPRRPFDLWLQALRSRVYVPRHTGAGVALYPYRVAAGIEPAYHFVVNASHGRMRLVHAPYSFLREDEKDALELGDRDLSEAYAAVYAHSGETVTASYAEESFSGPELPPSWFAERELVRPVSSQEVPADPFDAEREVFAGARELPPRVYPDQPVGLDYIASTGFTARDPDWSRRYVGDAALRERLLAGRRTKDPRDSAQQDDTPQAGMLRLSPSDAAAYRSCPFGYFLGRLLDLDPDAYTTGVRAAMDAGRAYHRGFERLYSRIREHGEAFRRDDLELYHGWVTDAALEATEGWALQSSSLSPAEVVSLRTKLEESMHALLDEDAERFDGWLIEVLERYEWVELDEGAILGGIMDRRMRAPGDGGAAVIDYKKNRLAAKKAFRVDASPDGEISELQMPLYAEILARRDRQVAGLYLYSIEKARYLSVFGDDPGAVLDNDGLAAARDAARARLDVTLSGIRSGDFRFPDPQAGCENCSFHGICRARFVTG